RSLHSCGPRLDGPCDGARRHAGELRMNGMSLYVSYIRNCLRAQMLYPTAFLLRLGSQFVITITEFGGLYALFARFSHIRGWTFAEIALFFGVVSVAFATALSHV